MSAGSSAIPARSVTSVVRAARAGLLAARALECVLLFVAAALLARSAALVSGVEGGAWSVASVCGALAAATWWCEQSRPLSATVRALDAALHHQGALALAFELERRVPPAGQSERSARLSERSGGLSERSGGLSERSGGLSERSGGLSEMEELVRARVLARLRVAPAVRAVLPSFLVPLAAPAVAALCLLLALERTATSAPAPPDVSALAAGLERALAAGLETDEPAGAASTEARELRQEAATLRALLAGPSEAPEEVRTAGARAVLERLDRRLAEREGRAAPASARGPRRDEPRAWLDALRAALPAPAGEGATGTGAGNLTGAAPDGTISRPMADPAAPPAALPDAPPLASLGLQAGTFWPPEYDAVIARWIELSRAGEAPGDR